MIWNRTVKNAAWMIGCKVVQSIIGLIISMLTARYLGPANYGLINYAASLVAFFTPIMQLGLNGILVQELVATPETEGECVGSAIVLNIISGTLCLVGLMAFTTIVNVNEKETLIVCALYSVSMLAEALHIIQYWFQARLLSKYSSLAMLLAYAAVSIYQVCLLLAGKGVYWFAVAKAFDIFFIDIFLLLTYHLCGGQRLSFSWKRSKEMLARSKHYILANMMVVIFAQTDRIMLKMMIDEGATGYYSAAVTCTCITSFIFNAIIDSMRPGILSSKRKDQKRFHNEMKLLYAIVIYLSLAQSVLMTALAPIIVNVLYGEAFGPSVGALQVIVWYTTFSYIGAVRNIWILAEGKQHILWKINLVGALANVLLNCALIPRLGIVGAAVASLITQIFTNVIVSGLHKELRENLQLMIQSLNVRTLVTAISGVLSK